MTSQTTKLRQILITTGRVVARREQVVGSVCLHRPLDFDITLPCELEISWVIISLGSSATQEQYAGIRLHMDYSEDVAGGQDCYLDIDEVQDFLDGIEVVHSFEQKLSQAVSESRDVYYSTREDARIGISKLAGESDVRSYLSLIPSGGIYLLASGANDYSEGTSALIAKMGDEFTPIWKLTQSALEELRSILGT